MLRFCPIAYTPKGTPARSSKGGLVLGYWRLKGGLHVAQINIIIAGRPSVFLERKFIHICGMSWTHNRIVPIVPNTFAATGIDSCRVISKSRALSNEF